MRRIGSRVPTAPPPARALDVPVPVGPVDPHEPAPYGNGNPAGNGRPRIEPPRLAPELYGAPASFPAWRLAAGRLATLAAIGTGAAYLYWRHSTLPGTGELGLAFYVVEIANYVSLALTALLLWRLRWRRGPTVRPRGTLDVFVPVCGEPVEMVEQTLRAALAIGYPHRTYLLNDGRIAGREGWQAVEDLSRRYGVLCFTRTSGARGKAGNLNHALRQTDGDFVAVIDADHRARTELADETLGYFADPAVGFVCTPQQFEGSTTDPLGNRELLFYRSMQPAKDVGNSAFSCGSGAIYRRSALAAIGGFSEWNIVEDVHTSLELHAAGWSSVYHPRPLATGLAPQTAATLATQRLRWATDSLRILFWRNPLLRRGLSPLQRLHYLQTSSFYLIGATQTLFLVGPMLYLLWDISVMRFSGPADYLVHGIPYYASIVLFLATYGGVRGGLRVIQQQLFLSPVYCLAVLAALVPVRLPGGVTDKARRAAVSPLIVPQWAAIVLCVAGSVSALVEGGAGLAIAGIWAVLLVTSLVPFVTAVGFSRAVTRGLRVAAASAAVAGVSALVAVTGLVDAPPGLGALPGAASEPAIGEAAVVPRPADVATAPAATFPPVAAEPAPGSAARRPAPSPMRVAPPVEGAYVGFYSLEALSSGEAVTAWGDRYSADVQIVNWYQQWLSGERRFRADWLELVSRQGATPMITWEPWEKPPGRVHTPFQPEVRLENIAAGRFDRYIRAWAQAAADYGRPILLRFMHEMNGTWYPWSIGTNGNSEEAYVAAWRHVHDLFVEEGATNVSWVWTINSFAGLEDAHRNLDSYYPGDEYVDWVSMTGFNWGDSYGWDSWRSVDEIFRGAYDALARLDKPIMISEIGTVDGGGDSDRWIRRALSRLADGYPRVKAVVWFDSPYPGDPDFQLGGQQAQALREALGSSDYWGQPVRLVPRAASRA